MFSSHFLIFALFNAFLLFIFTVPQLAVASYFFHPELKIWIEFETVPYSPLLGPQIFNISAFTTTRIYHDLCSVPSTAEVAGRVVLYDKAFQGCSYEDLTRNVQDAGAKGFIYITQNTAMWGSWGEAIETAGAAAYGLDGSDRSDIKIPAFNVVPKEIRPIVSIVTNSNQDVQMRMIPNENPFFEPFNWFRFYRIVAWVILTPWALLNTILAADTVRLLYIKEQGFSFQSLPQISCSIEIISNLIRLIFVSLGPFMTWHVLTYPAFSVFLTVTFPLSFLTSLLIAIYWKIVCNKIKSLNSEGFDIRDYRYLIIFLFLAESGTTWAGSILRANFMPVGLMVPINAFFEFISSGGLAIYFIIQGRRLVRLLEDHSKTMTKSFASSSRDNETTGSGILQQTITKMSKWIMASAIFTLVFLFAMMGIGSPFMYTPWGLSGFMSLSFVGVLGTSSTQVIAFRTQVTKKEMAKARSSFSTTGSRSSSRYDTQKFESQDIVIEEYSPHT